MGAGMDKVLPGLYVGSIRDSKDPTQIKKYNITHILSIYEDAKKGNIEVTVSGVITSCIFEPLFYIATLHNRT